MFDIEKSIADWRRQMLAAGLQTPVPLEELENHLREDIAQQQQSGLSAQQAFEIAVGKIGQAPELKREFKKVSAPMDMQKIIKLAGVFCVGIALFCPMFIFLSLLLGHKLSLMPQTKMLAAAVWAITVATIILSWRYNHKLLPAIRHQLPRRSVGAVCFGACLLWIRFGLFQLPLGGSHPQSLLFPLLVFGSEWLVMAILGGVGHGLEKAARSQTVTVDS